MPVALNHTIVKVKNDQTSALFRAEILGLSIPVQLGLFYMVATANGVSLNFMVTCY